MIRFLVFILLLAAGAILFVRWQSRHPVPPPGVEALQQQAQDLAARAKQQLDRLDAKTPATPAPAPKPAVVATPARPEAKPQSPLSQTAAVYAKVITAIDQERSRYGQQ